MTRTEAGLCETATQQKRQNCNKEWGRPLGLASDHLILRQIPQLDMSPPSPLGSCLRLKLLN